jgi:serine/threonine protein kinase
MLNQQIHNYKILYILGEGGMGTVYLAEHITIQRKVAVKVLHSQLTKNESLRQRFQNEAVLMAKLQHPNIVGLIDFFEQEGNLFLIMEYVEGIGLDDFIKNLNTPVSIERGKNIMLQILNGFAYAHSNGIIHRDVKPSNILITKNDEVKILDFGIAKLLDDVQNKLTKTGTQIGTAYYMSPEQVKAQELDQRTDIYSLGITFYELLSGFCPYANSQSEYDVYRRIVEEPLIPLSESLGNQYDYLWGIIEKQTKKNKEFRYSSCNNIILDITRESEDQLIFEEDFAQKESYPEQLNLSNDISNTRSSTRLKSIIITIIIFLSGYYVFNNSFFDAKGIDVHDDDTLSIEEKTSQFIKNYFEASDNGDINAFDYFAPHVSQYFRVSNTNPAEINSINEGQKDFTNRESNIVKNSIFLDREVGEIKYWTFWLEMSCYRVSKQKHQTCKVKIEFGINKDIKIVSYRELEIQDLKFE